MVPVHDRYRVRPIDLVLVARHDGEVESQRSPVPKSAEGDGTHGTSRAAWGVSSVQRAVGNKALGRLGTSDGARLLQRLTSPRPLARWSWPWETPQLGPDEPVVIDRDFQLDPHLFVRPSDGIPDDPHSQDWVQGQWSTADFKGEQQASVTEITKTQLYEEIGKSRLGCHGHESVSRRTRLGGAKGEGNPQLQLRRR
jgi:hypothetical protein